MIFNNWPELAVSTAGIVAILAIGYFNASSRHHLVLSNISFLSDFRNLFINWIESGCSDPNIYQKLILDTPKAERVIGLWGVMRHFSPPYSNITYSNFLVISNSIPEINKLTHTTFLEESANGYKNMVNECILRALGSFKEEESSLRKSKANPIKLLAIGFKKIVELPILILGEFGLVSGSLSNYLRNSFIVKSISLFAAIIAFGSVVMSIVIGWSDFTAKIAQILN